MEEKFEDLFEDLFEELYVQIRYLKGLDAELREFVKEGILKAPGPDEYWDKDDAGIDYGYLIHLATRYQGADIAVNTLWTAILNMNLQDEFMDYLDKRETEELKKTPENKK